MHRRRSDGARSAAYAKREKLLMEMSRLSLGTPRSAQVSYADVGTIRVALRWNPLDVRDHPQPI